MKLILPFPPSVNTYWRHPNKGALAGKSLISAAGRKFQSAACAAIIEQLRRLPKPTSAPASVEIVLFPPDTRFGPGQAIVTPAVIKGELLATYRQLERAGIVENYELFKQYLVVERDASDPNRLNTLFPPDYVNQLRVFAVVNQFRLQYSEESA